MKIKKVFCRLQCFVLVFLLLFTMLGTAPVYATGVTEFVFGKTMGRAGEEVVIPLSIKNNPGISTFRFRITYDTNALTFVSLEKGDVLTDGTLSEQVNPDSKTLTFLWYSVENLYGDGTLLSIKFKFSDTATGDYPLAITCLAEDMLNEDYEPIEYLVEEGEAYIGRAVSGVSINKSTVKLKTEQSEQLYATVIPDRVYNNNVLWESSDETVAIVDATGRITALKKGVATITVSTVDGGFTDTCTVYVDCAHLNKGFTAAKSATCSEGGWDAYNTCLECGQLFSENGTTEIGEIPVTPIDEENHKGIQLVPADPATCVHLGHDAYSKCFDCNVVTEGSDAEYYGAHNYGVLIPAVSEKHTSDELSPAVSAHYQCSLCEKYFTEEKVETTLEALTGSVPSHHYGNWVNVSENQHWKECGCGHRIEVDTHNYDNACDTTCDICGHTRTITHNWDSAWSNDNNGHWIECKECGAKKDAGNHTGGTATCQSKRVCVVCQKSYGTLEICNFVETVAPKYMKSPATCVAKSVYYKSCSICGKQGTETFVAGSVNPENHHFLSVAKKDASCTESGHSAYKVCEWCKLETGKTLIAATGHKYGEYVYNKDATESSDGTKTRTCTVCGKKETIVAEGTKLEKELVDTSKLFSDIKAKAWYKPYIDYAVSYGIINGTGNGKMEPNRIMTRAEFVQVLSNLAGVNTSNKKVNAGFKDVKSGAWYAPAVKWASENAVVNGTGGGKFSPNAKITREQMCTMMVRYVENYLDLTLEEKNAKQTFSDDREISSWAKSAVYKCQMAGLVNGVSADRFAPLNQADRASVATIMSRFHQEYVNQ